MPDITRHRFEKPAHRHKPTPAGGSGAEGATKSRSGLYSHKWREARVRFLRRHPMCEHCRYESRVIAATEIDHIIPHRGDMKLFWDKSNWMALCKPCHSRKTAKENGGFGNKKV